MFRPGRSPTYVVTSLMCRRVNWSWRAYLHNGAHVPAPSYLCTDPPGGEVNVRSRLSSVGPQSRSPARTSLLANLPGRSIRPHDSPVSHYGLAIQNQGGSLLESSRPLSPFIVSILVHKVRSRRIGCSAGLYSSGLFWALGLCKLLVRSVVSPGGGMPIAGHRLVFAYVGYLRDCQCDDGALVICIGLASALV
jgi:hypothetical protein